MEIRKLEIDIEAGVLKVNGEDYKEKPVIVTLPGPEDWPLVRLFNSGQVTGILKEYTSLSVSCVEISNMPL